jgi:WD40 repeat protein
MTLRFALITGIAAAALPAGGLSPIPRTFVRIHNNQIEVLDLGKQTWRSMHRAHDGWLNGLSVAPSGNRVAVLAWTRGTVRGHDYAILPAAQLVVIDTLGQVLTSVPNVHEYAWCGGNCLAYLTGQYNEDSDWGFTPEGAGLLDIATGKTARLAVPEYTVRVTWNPRDSALYLRQSAPGLPVHRLDLTARSLSRTDLHDHDFSPSGEYYLSRPFGTESLTVYRTATNSPVDISSLLKIADVVGWAGPSGDVLLAVRHVPPTPRKPGEPRIRPIRPEDIRPLRYFLFRISDGRVLDEAEGFLHELAGAGKRWLIRQGERYRVLAAPNS